MALDQGIKIKRSRRVGAISLRPLGTGADDAPRLSAAMAACAGKYSLEMLGDPSTPWQIKSTCAALSNLRLICSPGVVVNVSLPYAQPWIEAAAPTVNRTTVNGAHAIGSRVITLNAISGTGWSFVADGFLFFYGDFGRMAFKIVSVNVGAKQVTLDRPIWVPLAGGEGVSSLTPVQNFRLEANGALVTGSFTGTPTDSRLIELITCFDSYIEGLRTALSNDPSAVIGFDQGSRNPRIRDCHVVGNNAPLSGAAAAYLVEGCDGAVIDNCIAENSYGGLCTNYSSRGLRASNITAIRCGTIIQTVGGQAALPNVDCAVRGISASECGLLSYQTAALDDLSISEVRGTFAVTGSQLISQNDAAKLHLDDVKISVAQTTGAVLLALHSSQTAAPAEIKMRNVKIDWAGSGWRYGILAYAGAPVIDLEDCELGAFGTAFYSGVGSAVIRKRGRVTFTGALNPTPMVFPRAVTINGATVVQVPAVGVVEAFIRRRLTTGGTPGALPIATPVAAAAAVTVPAATTWGSSGLADFPAEVMKEDGNTGGHEIVGAAGAGFVLNGAVLFCVRAKKGTRNCIFPVAGNSSYAGFNLNTGAVVETSPDGSVAWMVSDGAGGYYCYILSPKVDSTCLYVYMSDDGLGAHLSYLGNGSTVEIIGTPTLSMVDYISVAGTAADTSQYELDAA